MSVLRLLFLARLQAELLPSNLKLCLQAVRAPVVSVVPLLTEAEALSNVLLVPLDLLDPEAL